MSRQPDNLATPFAPPVRNDGLSASATRLEDGQGHDKGHLAHSDFHAPIDNRIFGNDITKRCGGFEHNDSTGRTMRQANGARSVSLIQRNDPINSTNGSSLSHGGAQ